MKNLLLSFFIITGFAACKSDPKLDTGNRNIQLLSDSTVYRNNVFSDTAETVKAGPIPEKILTPSRKATRTKKNIAVKSTVSAPVYTTPATVPAVATPPVVTTSENTTRDSSSNGSTAAGTGTDSNSGTTAPVPGPEKKKGWSKAAQGAAIGGVTGAIGGAVISKKKGLGAVIGGVVGAAGGYIIGKGMDKKDNRFIIE